MSNELKQLEPLRRQAALIKAMLNHLQSLCGDYEVVENARITFNKIIAIRIRDKRAEFNDEDPNRFELDIDGRRKEWRFTDGPGLLIKEISTELKNLLKMSLSVCDSNIDPLFAAIKDFQNFEMGMLKNVFR